MKNIYSTPNMKLVIFSARDVITTSDSEIGVQYNGDNWGTDGSWMDGVSGNN